jgi:hypothetical protein
MGTSQTSGPSRAVGQTLTRPRTTVARAIPSDPLSGARVSGKTRSVADCRRLFGLGPAATFANVRRASCPH